MVSHNNKILSNHFRKHWQTRVRTWFNQPARQYRRRQARIAKAKRVFPRPTKSLRPIVRCATLKYNTKIRAGRGFTLKELEGAGITERYARSVGISVDTRRHNKSEESLALNVDRLKEYLGKLVILPQKKKGEDLSQYKQIIGEPMPVKNIKKPPTEIVFRKVTEEEAKFKAFATLRLLRRTAREHGRKAKKAAEEANGIVAPKKK